MTAGIPLARPLVVESSQLVESLNELLRSRVLSNFGPWHERLRLLLKEYFRTQNLSLVCNATVGLDVAFKALDLKGEVITSPFSFIATASSLAWAGLEPIFCDIDPQSFNVDASQIEGLITDKTSAILLVHTFGNVCEIEKIKKIADRYKLKIVYDAAHCFDVFNRKTNESAIIAGDASIISFHATKTFNSIEGGGIYFLNEEIADRAQRMINFGITAPNEIRYLGINGKMSEVHALIGVYNLGIVKEAVTKRRRACERFKSNLSNQANISLQKLNLEFTEPVSYMPVLFGSESILMNVMKRLELKNVGCRRYFYPSLNTLDFLSIKKQMMVTAEDISRRILCLPMHQDLEIDQVDYICELITSP